jgi:hypothetical protein
VTIDTEIETIKVVLEIEMLVKIAIEVDLETTTPEEVMTEEVVALKRETEALAEMTDLEVVIGQTGRHTENINHTIVKTLFLMMLPIVQYLERKIRMNLNQKERFSI